jgi:hypothetical protein
MDLTKYTQAKSDQLNADDLHGGPIVVRITAVRERGTPDQPVEIAIEGHRPWRPCKASLRVLVAAWGADGRAYVGRWVRLYRDPTAKWGGVEVGGIRIAAMSDIPRPLRLAIAESKQKRITVAIDVLTPPAASAAPDLATVLTGAGLTLQDLDAWRAGQNKPPAADLNDAQRAQLAGWLMADPARLEALRPVEPTPEDTAATGWEE